MNTYVRQYRLIVTSISILCLAGAVLAADPILTLSGSAGKPLAAPRVAFNPVNELYLTVFEFHYGTTDWDIDGRLVDPNGQLTGEGLAIAWSGSIVQQEPDVAYNPVTNQFLVVYALAPDNWKISACIVAGDGTPGPFVPIATSTFKEYHPEVACDPTTGDYLVVYEREHQLDSTIWREVWAQRVNSDGTLISDPYQISNPGLHSYQCAIACAGGQFLVVWREQQTSGKGRILGRIIQSWYPSKTTLVIASARDSSSPKVAYNPTRAEYFVVYQTRTNNTACWFLEGMRVNTLGDMKGANSITTAIDEHCKAPDVAYAWADGQYLVTWAQGPADAGASVASHQIWAQRVDGSGEPVDSPIPISDPGKDQPVYLGIPAPAIAAGFCGKALIVWEDQRQVIDPAGPSTTIYSILGAHGTWSSPCDVSDYNSME
jgi:hypothetical protein